MYVREYKGPGEKGGNQAASRVNGRGRGEERIGIGKEWKKWDRKGLGFELKGSRFGSGREEGPGTEAEKRDRRKIR